LVGEDGQPVPPGEIGELQISGPAVAAGYAGGEPFPVGQFGYCTGDYCRRDTADFFYFEGWAGGIIKSAGLKISPQEIETVLRTHEKVAEVVLVAVEDEVRGSVYRAFVEPVAGGELRVGELRAFLAKRLPPAKIPAELCVLREIPRTPAGKPDLAALRAWR